jgi:hypothetical protein
MPTHVCQRIHSPKFPFVFVFNRNEKYALRAANNVRQRTQGDQAIERGHPILSRFSVTGLMNIHASIEARCDSGDLAWSSAQSANVWPMSIAIFW